MICKSCNSRFYGKFCSNCGSPSEQERITLKQFAEEVLHSLTSFHQKTLKTIKTCIIKPELVVIQYITGIRNTYFNPVNFYFLTMASSAFFTYRYDLHGPRSVETSTKLPYELIHLNNFLYEYFTFFFTLVLPVFSVFSYLSFKRKKYNYAEHLFLNVIFFGIGNFIYLALVPILILLGNQQWHLGLELFNVLWLAYLSFAYIRTFGGNKITTVIKCISFYIISLLIVGAISYYCFRLFSGTDL